MGAHTALLAAGVSTRAGAALTGVARATAARTTARAASTATPAVRAVLTPANRLSDAERTHVLSVLNSEQFVDAPPVQVYARLMAAGTYLCSISTMYRVLAEHAQVKERRRLARHPARVAPELVATGPGQVYTWDITKLPGPTRGVYYDAYVMIDIYSRYIVGAHVHATESGVLAEEMVKQIFDIHGVPQVVHADRGTSMTSKTVAALLGDLGVTRSHSRPKVSNDNPYSDYAELVVQDVEVRPGLPGTVRLATARPRLPGRVRDGLQPRAPPQRHRPTHRRRCPLRPRRSQALTHARAAHPERFTNYNDPQILALPEAAWINPPPQPASAA